MKHATHPERIQRVVGYLADHLDEELDLEAVARVAHFSPYHFHRIFRAAIGETVNDTVRRLRLRRAALDLLADGAGAGFGLVLTDPVMPGASGRQVAEAALRRGCGGVVVVSGYRSRLSVADLADYPRVRYFDKPYDPRHLIAALDELARSAAVEGAP